MYFPQKATLFWLTIALILITGVSRINAQESITFLVGQPNEKSIIKMSSFWMLDQKYSGRASLEFVDLSENEILTIEFAFECRPRKLGVGGEQTHQLLQLGGSIQFMSNKKSAYSKNYTSLPQKYSLRIELENLPAKNLTPLLKTYDKIIFQMEEKICYPQ